MAGLSTRAYTTKILTWAVLHAWTICHVFVSGGFVVFEAFQISVDVASIRALFVSSIYKMLTLTRCSYKAVKLQFSFNIVPTKIVPIIFFIKTDKD